MVCTERYIENNEMKYMIYNNNDIILKSIKNVTYNEKEEMYYIQDVIKYDDIKFNICFCLDKNLYPVGIVYTDIMDVYDSIKIENISELQSKYDELKTNIYNTFITLREERLNVGSEIQNKFIGMTSAKILKRK